MKFLATACVAFVAVSAQASYTIHDWNWSFAFPAYNFSNVASEGTITGVSYYPGFASSANPYGLPSAIGSNNLISTGFQINGSTSVGGYIDFNFSSGYNWGTGGELILGNIHNYYQYRLEAWDQSNNQIDVNSWSTLVEYQSTAPGSSGYFSTSSTSRSAAGLASNFYVYDPLTSADLGQGGVVVLGGLSNVGKIRFTLDNSALAPNNQQVDFVMINVATPAATPEPVTMSMLTLGGLMAWKRRSRAR